MAAAVVEQSASTQDISRNINEAAGGARDLAGNMASMTEAINETNMSAAAVLEASSALTAQAGTLQNAVDCFLQRVRRGLTLLLARQRPFGYRPGIPGRRRQR